jgi:cyanophycin synthetase
MIENEREALQKAVETGRDGDLIVVFYESLEPLQQYLLSIHARPEPE